MEMKLLTLRIVGQKPLIQSNPHEMWAPPPPEDTTVKKAKRKGGSLRGTDSEDFLTAQKQLYVDDDGRWYHPAQAFWNVLLMACDGRNIGSTNALTIITRCVHLPEENFLLYDPTTLSDKEPKLVEGTEWQIDYRRAVNHNTNKGQGGVGVVAIRPKWKAWGGLLPIEIDVEPFGKTEDFDFLPNLLTVGGLLYGVGVGRRRVKAEKFQKPVWSGFGSGKFKAELIA